MTHDLQLELYYQNRFAMFAEQGWKDLIDDLKVMRESTDRLAGVTPEKLPYKQGELSIIDWMLSLEKASKDSYADLSIQMQEGSHDGITDALFDKAARH